MKSDSIYIVALFAGITACILAVILACVTSPTETAKRHHRHNRDLHGQVTCEYCKGLMKGPSHERH